MHVVRAKHQPLREAGLHEPQQVLVKFLARNHPVGARQIDMDLRMRVQKSECVVQVRVARVHDVEAQLAVPEERLH